MARRLKYRFLKGEAGEAGAGAPLKSAAGRTAPLVLMKVEVKKRFL